MISDLEEIKAKVEAARLPKFVKIEYGKPVCNIPFRGSDPCVGCSGSAGKSLVCYLAVETLTTLHQGLTQ